VEHALEVRGVSPRFGGVRALTDVSFGVNDGELFSIIGPNGAGKTLIVNCISSRYRPTEGQLLYREQDITALNPNAQPRLGIGRTFQNLALFHHMSVLDNIMVGRHHLLMGSDDGGSMIGYSKSGSPHHPEGDRGTPLTDQPGILSIDVASQTTAGATSHAVSPRPRQTRRWSRSPRQSEPCLTFQVSLRGRPPC
jgi:branched-chain amino acid transport system ATP-binding protein